MFRTKSFLWLIVATSLVFASCRKERFKPTWQTTWLAPFFNTDLKLQHLANDTLVNTNADGSLTLVYKNSLFSWDPNENAITIPDTTVRSSYHLTALDLADQSITYQYSLGQLASQIPGGQLIINANQTSAVIFAQDDITSSDIPVDATQFFQTATLATGFIDITIFNGYPVPIDNLVFLIKNQIAGDTLSIDTFTNIPPGGTQTKVIDLSGKYVEGTLVAKIIDLDTPGSNGEPVFIDTSDALVITMLAHDMTVESATAIFPSQNLIDEFQETEYGIENGAKLTKVRIKEGKLKLTINSALSQPTHFNYKLPSATYNGNADIEFNKDLAAGSPSDPSKVEDSFDLAGYELDLTGLNGDKYNTFVNHLTVSIDATNVPITLSASDSVYIDYGLTGIVPEYVEGYLGQQIINVGPEESELPVFNLFKSGTLQIEDVNVTFDIENSLGADGRINIYDLKSIRSNTGNTINLTAPNLMNTPIFVPRATDNPLTPSHTPINLTTTNSNIKPWLENIPDKVAYKLDVFLNPNGNVNNYQDFAYNTARVALNMNLELPLSFIANALVLEDTIDFKGLGTNAEGLSEANLKLTTTNGFPLSTQITIQLLDEFKLPLGFLTTNSLQVNAGVVDGDCLVSQPTVSVLNVPVPGEKMSWLRHAKYAVIHATFDTNQQNGCSGYLKIYDSYSLSCKLTGSVVYDITP